MQRGVTRYRHILTAAALLAAMLLAACGEDDGGGESSGGSAAAGGAACDTVKIAELDDPVVRASYYAIDEGIVSDPRVGKLEVDYLPIPALVQNTGSDRYDVTAAALNGVVNIREQTGRDFRVIAYKQASRPGGVNLWAAADSPLKSAAELKDKTLAVPGIGSSTSMLTEIVLAEQYGLDAGVNADDTTFTDLDPPTVMSAVKKGQSDAGLLFHFPNWQATQDPELKSIADLAKDYIDLFGVQPIGGALLVSPDSLEENPACFEALQAMLNESATYADEHVDEVATAVSEALKAQDQTVPTEYLEYWFEHNDYGSSVETDWLNGVDVFWKKAHERGLIPEPPTAEQATFLPKGA